MLRCIFNLSRRQAESASTNHALPLPAKNYVTHLTRMSIPWYRSTFSSLHAHTYSLTCVYTAHMAKYAQLCLMLKDQQSEDRAAYEASRGCLPQCGVPYSLARRGTFGASRLALGRCILSFSLIILLVYKSS